MARKRKPLVLNDVIVELDALGLQIVKRPNGELWQYWVVSHEGRRRGYLPRTIRLHYDLTTATGQLELEHRCKILTNEMAADARESAPLIPWRLHDLRRTGASTLARLGFDTIAIDKLLAHQLTKLRGVAAIYQRYDFAEERARALDAWAEHVLTSNPGERERPLDNAMLVVVGAGRRSIRSRP